MSKNKVRLECTKEQFYRMLSDEVTLYIRPHEGFRLTNSKHGAILKPRMMLQGGNAVNCKLDIETVDRRGIEVKIGFSPSVYMRLFVMAALVVIYFARHEVIAHFNFQVLVCILLYLSIALFIYSSERRACREFWERCSGKFHGEWKER